jgi:hypothetical protein
MQHGTTFDIRVCTWTWANTWMKMWIAVSGSGSVCARVLGLNSHLQTYLLYVIFQMESHFLPGRPQIRSFYLCLPHSWDDRWQPPPAAYLLRWGLTNFLLGLALETWSCRSPSPTELAWHDRHEPPCLARIFYFYLSVFTGFSTWQI